MVSRNCCLFVFVGCLLGVLGIGTAAIAAWRQFARPGIDGIAQLPAGPKVVVAIDLIPTPEQSGDFLRLADVLKRRAKFDVQKVSPLELLGNDPNLRKLAKLTGPSAAIGIYEDGIVARLPVRDEAQARKIAQGKIKSSFTLFVRDGAVFVGTSKQLLEKKGLLGAQPALMDLVRRNRDAHVMLAIPAETGKEVTQKATDKIRLRDWALVSGALQGGGIDFRADGAFDPESSPALKRIAQLPPLRTDLAKVLPGSALAVVAVTGPGAIVPLMSDADRGKAEKALRESVDLSLEGDLMPNLRGDMVVGLYPASIAPTRGLDLLVVMDAQRGAQPIAVVSKLMDRLEARMAKDPEAPKPFMLRREAAFGPTYRLNSTAERFLDEMVSNGGGVFKPNALGPKTLAISSLDGVVIASTSSRLHDAAVLAYRQNARPLAGDAAYSGLDLAAREGAQFIVAGHPGRFIQSMLATLSSGPKQAPEEIRAVLAALSGDSGKAGLMTGRIRPDGRFGVRAFYPVDIARLIDTVATTMEKARPPARKAPVASPLPPAKSKPASGKRG